MNRNIFIINFFDVIVFEGYCGTKLLIDKRYYVMISANLWQVSIFDWRIIKLDATYWQITPKYLYLISAVLLR